VGAQGGRHLVRNARLGQHGSRLSRGRVARSEWLTTRSVGRVVSRWLARLVGWTVVCPGDGPLVYQLGDEFSSRNNIVPTKFPTSNSICILALRDEGCRRSLR
jgi:hypothetical protein